MPLLDHFHAPLYPLRGWESFHARWAAAISDALNAHILPVGYFAEIQSHVGSRVEVDVATLTSKEHRSQVVAEPSVGGVATLEARPWSPPRAAMSMPAIFPDSIEVLVYGASGGPKLVAAVELVSPGNKDRPRERRGFAAKCATYLQQGVGLIVVDVVTGRDANLHNELVDLLNTGHSFTLPDGGLYAVAYRPVRRTDEERIDVWPAPLKLGGALPLLPLALDRMQCVPLDLEAPYMEAVQRSRIV